MTLIPTQRQFRDLGLNAPAKRENPYHDSNGKFCSAGQAAGNAKSEAMTLSRTIENEKAGWSAAAEKSGMDTYSAQSVKGFAETAQGHIDSASWELQSAVHAWDQGVGDEGPSQAYAAAMGTAAGYLEDASRALQDACSEFGGNPAPDSLVTARDDTENLTSSVNDMYQASMASSGYDPTLST
jgi:hypothetical protein